MRRVDIICETSRFNLSEPRDYFINESCFGDDFAKWLREQLIAKGLQVTPSGQEDWGWYIEATTEQGTYFIGIGGNANKTAASPNEGEWRIMVHKHRSMFDRILAKNGMTPNDAILNTIEEILRAETFSNLRRE